MRQEMNDSRREKNSCSIVLTNHLSTKFKQLNKEKHSEIGLWGLVLVNNHLNFDR